MANLLYLLHKKRYSLNFWDKSYGIACDAISRPQIA